MSELARAPVLLIVDDEPRILSALRRTLRREGYEILVADSSREALRLLEEHAVDLILSDHKMPVMTGLELLARAARLRPAAARLLITGWTEAIPEAEIQAVGVRAVIPKPWDDGELKEILRKTVKDSP